MDFFVGKHQISFLKIIQTPLNQTNVVFQIHVSISGVSVENYTSAYIGHRNIIFSCCLTYQPSNISAIKKQISRTHSNNADKFTSAEIWEILINNNRIIHNNDNKKRLQILKVISIKNKQLNVNKIAFNIWTNKLNIFNI